jgi:hypothetical protein
LNFGFIFLRFSRDNGGEDGSVGSDPLLIGGAGEYMLISYAVIHGYG